MTDRFFLVFVASSMFVACRAEPTVQPIADEPDVVVTPVVVAPPPEEPGEPVAERSERPVRVDPEWVAIDRKIVSMCPNLSVRAEAVIDLERSEPAESDDGEVVSDEPRWRELAVCMKSGPLQGFNLEVVPYRRQSNGNPAQMVAAVADELIEAGVPGDRIEFDPGDDDMFPPALDTRVMIRVAELDRAGLYTPGAGPR